MDYSYLFTEVRVFAESGCPGEREICRFLSTIVPRIGDRFYVQYKHYEILDCQWSLIENKLTVDLIIDMDVDDD